MSALGHKRTFALQNVMSALPPIATLIAHFADLHRLQTEPAQQNFSAARSARMPSTPGIGRSVKT
jgi:hypothetical protein